MFQGTPPHVSDAVTPPLDLSQIICIALIGLTSILLLFYVLFVRCRYLRRRKCSLCGLTVSAGSGRERVEGFWQRMWHEQCWRKRRPADEAEKGAGKGKGKGKGSEEKKGTQKENMRLVPPRGVGSETHSSSSSVSSTRKVSPGSSSTSPNLPLPAPSATNMSIHANYPSTQLYDPYAPLPPIGRQQQDTTLLPPPRSTSRYHYPQSSHPQDRAQYSPSAGNMRTIVDDRSSVQHAIPRSPLATSYFPNTLSVLPTHMIGMESTMGNGRVAELEPKWDLPPRQDSRGGAIAIMGQAL